MTPELREILFAIVGPMFGGIAVYAAIRSDLADLRARMAVVERSLDRAHQRIDDAAANHNSHYRQNA